MHAANIFKGMVLGVMVFILALVFSLKEATAGQMDDCVAQSNLVVSIAEARDDGMSKNEVILELLGRGAEFSAAYEFVEAIYNLSALDPETLGKIIFKNCMGEAA